MYNLIVPSGIGDFSWIYSKFYNLGKEINLIISKDFPPRCGPYAELLSLIKSVNYEGPTYSELKEKAVHNFKEIREDVNVCVEVNSHLEAGKNLKNWLPELSINYHFPINIKSTLKLPEKYIIIYASNTGTVKHWNGWDSFAWRDFIHMFKAYFGNYHIVLIGATWDVRMVRKIMTQLRGNIHNYVGKLELVDSLHIIKNCKYFIAFPSGLPILANVLNVPTTMFYPEQIKNIMGTFADPETIKNGTFNEMLFCTPSKYFSWLTETYKIGDKL